jgi:glycosyltransferase involved in cell wall biosynthesis
MVATSAGGVPDVVVPGTGLLADRGDHEGIARALVELSGDPALRQAMGARARDHVRARYRYEALLANMTSLYERLVDEGGRR